jgi:hypothetical protein
VNIEIWPGAVTAAAPGTSRTEAGADAGEAQGCAGACSAVELSTASALVHAIDAS